MRKWFSEAARRGRFQTLRLLLAARGAALLAADTGWLLLPKPGRAAGRRKVLVIRLDRIGDFLLWLPAARALRDLYPQGQYDLTLLAHPSWAELAGDQDLFDNVRALDVRRFVWSLAYRFEQLGWVRRAGFATVIQARYSRELFVEDALVRVSGAAHRVGFRREPGAETRFQRPLSDRWYTALVGTGEPPVMELERNAQLVRALGLTTFQTTVPRLCVGDPPPSLRRAPYYVLFPGASWDGKRWPLANFQEVARRLGRQTGWTGVVCGGPGEELLGERLTAEAGVPLENWIGRTSLAQSAALIAGARVLIGNDTSGIHMAASVGTPSVCVLGGGHYGRFLPYPPVGGADRGLPLPVITPMACFGCGWRCVYHVEPGQPVPCVRDVSVESVWQSVCRVLREGGSLTASAAPSAAGVPNKGI